MRISKLGLSFAIILLMFISSLSGCTELSSNFEIAGEKDPVTIPRSTHSEVIFIFQLGLESINLEIISTATYLVDVVNRVSIREGSSGTVADAEAVTFVEFDSDTMEVYFDSNDEDIRINYKYDLTIKVASNITLEIDFIVVTGNIATTLSDNDLAISSLDLDSTTGSIDLTLAHLVFLDSIPSIQLSI